MDPFIPSSQAGSTPSASAGQAAVVAGPGVARTQLPRGFTASGINCGVRRYRPDLGVILSDVDCVAAAVFTQNSAAAAPVRYCQSVLPSTHCRAVLTNSGQANALTGPAGERDNLSVVLALAESLMCQPEQVLIASTGVIGVPLEVEKIVGSFTELLQRQSDVAEHFALAIMTTDLVPKTFSTQVTLSSGKAQITGIAKGSGMIHPNMATMLGYILTDAEMSVAQATHMLKIAVDSSFNMISVDGDTSTNDGVFLLANGVSGVKIENATDHAVMQEAISAVAQALAKSIARDGEGATKLVEVQVSGLDDLQLMRSAARHITTSPLVKTAIHGADPNWGRIMAKLGSTGLAEGILNRADLSIQGVPVLQACAPVSFDRELLRKQLAKEHVVITLKLGTGALTATAWGCDLSKKYVEINTDYTT